LLAAGVAGAQARKDGLPAYVNGYTAWAKVNKAPIRGGSSAHQGVKNVYASKQQVGRHYPLGTIVVTRSSPTARFAKVGFPESGCAACHMQAKANDYVFTRR
jgi:hypothetical protein